MSKLRELKLKPKKHPKRVHRRNKIINLSKIGKSYCFLRWGDCWGKFSFSYFINKSKFISLNEKLFRTTWKMYLKFVDFLFYFLITLANKLHSKIFITLLRLKSDYSFFYFFNIMYGIYRKLKNIQKYNVLY